ncbi:MFS-type efflux transporter phmH [Parastagonospora nodorum]|uniref:MFS-type efflux transporter phmH n=1 Tax=Phaeosphaeria nodorum (strain SN15 / ATCC MYA-4574 / FGSC 10173) TaxID=321614 RepID=A0A7U2HW39_PHANO|nr:MFS-type efflux transporter phmH [Parastagonospora nodorum]QRC90796.1 MFS-type efflux transporter phmH [Parastagonospora nodorum SN15]KAH3935184.1 MFS-type efflux transporter phmH [Parastagonospora nodorum]KAH3943621.1 MFS-type efflux transporter phmH [Parastagonospora nodorum]KAH3986784.1 MFS-type efflux transporter phmH [Parastagonospora nodorum]
MVSGTDTTEVGATTKAPPSEGTEGILDDHSSNSQPQAEKPAKTHYPLSFWLAFLGLCCTGLVSALDGSIVATALPSIIESLDGGDDYVWVANVYFLTSAALQPLYGQLADLWGRRYVMIGATIIFILGSGLCGGSSSMNMLIWSRAVQGIGAGGINMLIDMIICDLVPMRERGNFIGLLFLFVSLGATIGPFVGGILTDRASWRWIFYINLPFGGVALLLLILFLHVKWKNDLSTMERLRRVDVIGNSILIGATFAILYALTYGGTRYTWSDPHIAAPLTIGLVGLVAAFFWEMSPWCKYPVMPPLHFQNRTSAAAFFISFMCMLLAFWINFFYPVYFQAVLIASPTRAGVYTLPRAIAFPLFAAVGGAIVSKTGRYRTVHLVSTGIMPLVMGLSSILDQGSSKAEWVIWQLLFGVSGGMMISTTLQAVQAALPESEVATSVGTWSFVRSLGTIWGLSIPAAIFNNRFDQLSTQFDPSIRALFTRGQAYEHGTAKFIQSFDPETRQIVIQAYIEALKRVWQIGIVFGGVTFLSVFFEKEIHLRTELKTDFGLDEKKKGEVAKEENDVENNGTTVQ